MSGADAPSGGPASAIAIELHQLSGVVGAWRKLLDPSGASGFPPHITLAYPWRPSPLAESDLNDVSRALAGQSVFDIRFEGFDHFDNRVLYLVPNDGGRVAQLIDRLETAFPEFPLYGGEIAEVIPHVTVAHDVDVPSVAPGIEADVLPRLPLTVPVHEVTLFEYQDASWVRFGSVPLDQWGTKTSSAP